MILSNENSSLLFQPTDTQKHRQTTIIGRSNLELPLSNKKTARLKFWNNIFFYKELNFKVIAGIAVCEISIHQTI